MAKKEEEWSYKNSEGSPFRWDRQPDKTWLRLYCGKTIVAWMQLKDKCWYSELKICGSVETTFGSNFEDAARQLEALADFKLMNLFADFHPQPDVPIVAAMRRVVMEGVRDGLQELLHPKEKIEKQEPPAPAPTQVPSGGQPNEGS